MAPPGPLIDASVAIASQFPTMARQTKIGTPKEVIARDNNYAMMLVCDATGPFVLRLQFPSSAFTWPYYFIPRTSFETLLADLSRSRIAAW